MKAAVYTSYGPPEVLHITEVAKPVPRDNEVLIEIYATTVKAGDWRMRQPNPFAARLYNGLFKPTRYQILGMELAGRIEAVGSNVSHFKPGDEVFASTGITFGGYAEYRCLPESGVIALKPGNISLQEAAAVPSSGIAALEQLKKAHIFDLKSGQKVLINGATGAIGSYAVQLARYFGAEVTAVCRTEAFEFARELGAHKTIDYTTQDFTEGTERYDIIFDAAGKRLSGLKAAKAKKVLNPGGTFVSMKDNYKETAESLTLIKDLIEKGHIRPAIGKTFRLEDIVEAHRYAESGNKIGNAVVVVKD
jgi:NADPH:quinone reductase-like Zn-dependent oxidoreductase